jgi:3-hydroxybutyryl-CoA dehydrogenase
MTVQLEAGSTVAVIGSGAMGSGIAQVAAAAGHQVILFDTRDGAASKAIADIGKVFSRLVEKGRMSGADADAANGRMRVAASIADVRDAAIVIEAIVEDLDVKRSLFAELETIVGDD